MSENTITRKTKGPVWAASVGASLLIALGCYWWFQASDVEHPVEPGRLTSAVVEGQPAAAPSASHAPPATP